MVLLHTLVFHTQWYYHTNEAKIRLKFKYRLAYCHWLIDRVLSIVLYKVLPSPLCDVQAHSLKRFGV